ncbi:MAG: type II secretion system protein [Campylobacterota bacterium]|nr:type II secretion system protein [Campylobacterota bacterium]
MKKKDTLKKSFSLLELIFVIVLIAIISSSIISKNEISKLQIATDKIVLYLNYARYIAFIDNKFDINDAEWERKRWTLKFQNCSDTNDGMYYIVYSDMSGGTAAFKKDECMKDPLSQKYLYSGYDCEPSSNESKNILLTKEFGVEKVEISCNTTSTIGQISFGNDGKIYSQLGTNIKEINEQCLITLYDINDDYTTIAIEPKTGYIHKL